MKNLEGLGKTYSVVCQDLSNEGLGIAKTADKMIFVKGLLPKEKAIVKVTKVTKVVLFGEIVSLLTPSTKRITPSCPHFNSCGGCNLAHLNYEAQLAYKQEKVINLFKKNASLEPVVSKTVGMKDPFSYRHKVQVPVKLNKKKEIVTGFYSENSHDLIPIDTCLIEDKLADTIVSKVKQLLKDFHYMPYDEDTRIGNIRHILVKISKVQQTAMVVLVTNEFELKGANNFARALIAIEPHVKTIVQNINNRITNVILGEKENIIYGTGYITDEICGMKFRISSKSFFQVNPEQATKLYELAIELADLKGTEKVLDAYCGTGTIGIIAASKAKSVTGIDIVYEAIVDAMKNAYINKIENITFLTDDCERYMPRAGKHENYDVVFVDPPRKGLGVPFIQAMMEMLPKRIVYISCDPDSLTKDISLMGQFYEVKKVVPVDMFPQTIHVETVVMLERK